ncbi:MAG: zinc ribbon domain-containing protein [Gemmatimonadota bacterium]|nr:zinc ribbon domain-containing protein [Gemmatimonadota bacterium]
MTDPSSRSCPACGADAAGKFCSACGASLGRGTCSHCQADLSSQARFCHRCGRPAGAIGGSRSDRKAWIIAGTLCVLLVGGIAYKISSAAPGPAAPDMANAGSSTGLSGPAPDISAMTPRERFDRLFNRITQAAERGDSAEIERFTPMAIGAYQQLETRDVDARYHAAVLHMQVGNFAAALALADTILAKAPGHLFGYIIRGETAGRTNDSAGRDRARRDFLTQYDTEMKAGRVEYLEHKPAVDDFKEK